MSCVNTGIWQAKDQRLVRHGISIKINSRIYYIHIYVYVLHIACHRELGVGRGRQGRLMLLPAAVFSLSCTLAHAWPALRYEDDDATRQRRHRRRRRRRRRAQVKLWHLRARQRRRHAATATSCRRMAAQAVAQVATNYKKSTLIRAGKQSGGQHKKCSILLCGKVNGSALSGAFHHHQR